MEERPRNEDHPWIHRLCRFAAAIGGFGGSDDESTAATGVDDSPLIAEGTDYADDSSGEADRVVELTDEGQEHLAWMTDWSTTGQTDPATACGQLTTAQGHVDRLADIVNELGNLDTVSSDNLADLRSTHADLQSNVANVAALCVAAD